MLQATRAIWQFETMSFGLQPVRHGVEGAMAIESPERAGTRSRWYSHSRGARGPRPWGILVIAGLVALVLLAPGFVRGLLPDFDLPFGETTRDHSGPVVLRAIQDVREFKGATGHFEVVVDLENDTRFVPDRLRGERTLFVAVGTVDASVDFSGVGPRSVQVTGSDSVSITLPRAHLSPARIDPEHSYVANRERGLLDRITGFFEDTPTGERDLYLAAEKKLEHAATSTGELRRQAEANTRQMLESMLRPLGYETVIVRFAQPRV